MASVLGKLKISEDFSWLFWREKLGSLKLEKSETSTINNWCLIIQTYEGHLKSSLADQNTLMECEQMKFIFQHILPSKSKSHQQQICEPMNLSVHSHWWQTSFSGHYDCIK